MRLYYILILLSVLSLFLRNRVGNFVGWCTFILMAVMTIFRGNMVGTDTVNYLQYGAEHRIEEYFNTWIMALISQGIIDNRSLIYILGIVTYIFIVLCVKKNNIDIRYFNIFFFISGFFAMGLNISRQVAATMIIAYFLPYIFERNTKKSLLYILGCILGAGFHISSLFIVYLYALRFVRFSINHIQILIVILGLAILLNILPIASIMQMFLPDIYSNEYSNAINRDLDVSMIGYIYRIFIIAVYAFMCKFISKRKDIWLFAFSAIIVNSVIGMNTSVSRIFTINSFILILFNCYVYVNDNLNKDLTLKLLFIVQLLMGYYTTLMFIQNHPNLNQFEFVTF